ncbi:MAG: hypothetical protein L0Z50_35770 [Verrucomicrobiales bacterium]|nr:hypothetical protein [Verrucomicrobiales bacterium]
MSITEGGVTFLRMQDTGDPRGYGFSEPSNRKVYFGHDITAEGAPDTILDDGVTLSFRARIPTLGNANALIDDLYLSGGTTPTPYPSEGDGYLISDGGVGNVGVKQLSSGMISFALTVPHDNFDDSDPTSPTADFSGLTMNKLNGPVVGAPVDFNSDSSAEFRGAALDPTAWHEFWITIKADTNGVGTHEVSVYLDGSTQAATNVVVTAGFSDEHHGIGYLGIGGSRTVESWALDLDFVAYKNGAEAPSKAVEAPKFTSIVRQADNVIITWTGGGILQSATEAAGSPWSDIAGVTSPATVKISDPRRFYRVKN